MIYQKIVDGVKKLFYTESIPTADDVEVTYVDTNGEEVTLVEKDTYVDNSSANGIQKIKRLSDNGVVNVMAGDKCLIGEVEVYHNKISLVTFPPEFTGLQGGEMDSYADNLYLFDNPSQLNSMQVLGGTQFLVEGESQPRYYGDNSLNFDVVLKNKTLDGVQVYQADVYAWLKTDEKPPKPVFSIPFWSLKALAYGEDTPFETDGMGQPYGLTAPTKFDLTYVNYTGESKTVKAGLGEDLFYSQESDCSFNPSYYEDDSIPMNLTVTPRHSGSPAVTATYNWTKT